MSAEIAPELKEKLRIIELETGFFWDKPQQPRFPKIYFWVSLLALLGIVVGTWEKQDIGLLLVFVLLPAINLMAYFHSKQQFEQFSQACELIRYYKKLTEQTPASTAGVSLD